MPAFAYARYRSAVPRPFHYVPPDEPVDPGSDIPPTMPSTSLTGWTLQYSQDFDTPCTEGTFLNTTTYGGTAHTTDIGTGQFFAYPSGQHDTRGTGAAYQNGTLPGPAPDYGTYDPNVISVSGGIMKIHLYTDGAGVHHVCTPRPKIEGRNASPYSTLGGRYAVCWRCTADIPTYKIAWLLWPQSQVWPRDGEIDWPEMGELKTGSHIAGFMHRQGGVGQDQALTSSSINSGWHTDIIEWRPEPGAPSTSTLNFIHDGVTVGAYSGTTVPNTAMYWALQTETFLDYSIPINSSANGFVEIAWVAYWTKV